MVTTSLLATLLIALAVTTQPTAAKTSSLKLSFSKKITPGAVKHIVKHNRRRIKHLLARADGTTPDEEVNTPATNEFGVAYLASVGVGCPATYYDIVIDTGSSNTWVGATKPYVPTSTSHRTSNNVSAEYGSGNFNGSEVIDQVTISSELVIPRQSIGVATESAGFNGVDGILGIGPRNLTYGTLNPANKTTIPTVTDNLFASGAIDEYLLGIYFEPPNPTTNHTGEISWGAVDHTKFIGDITYGPVTSIFSSNRFWGVEMAVAYGDVALFSYGTAGIVDTGTAGVLMTSGAFKAYQNATGAVFDNTTQLLTISPTQYASLKSMYFTFEGTVFELTANAQIFARDLNTATGGSAEKIYLVVIELDPVPDGGLEFVVGQAFLERFYSAYDTANNRVGLAKTKFTHATTN